jgi:hypothetical protein
VYQAAKKERAEFLATIRIMAMRSKRFLVLAEECDMPPLDMTSLELAIAMEDADLQQEEDRLQKLTFVEDAMNAF